MDVRRGDPAEHILAKCNGEGVDLIVMATRGRGGLRRAFLGSVADTVVREPGVRVLVIRP